MLSKIKRLIRHAKWLAEDSRARKELVERARDGASELHRLTPHQPGFLADQSPIVIFRSRNEILRLPAFLTHYRNLGVGGFIAIDNLSADGSVEYLGQQEDVLLYSASGSYSARAAGIDWVNHLLWQHAQGRWIIMADVDELLAYPGIETAGIRGIIESAEHAGDRSIYTPMLDMYSSSQLSGVDYVRGESFLSVCNHFDHPDCYALAAGRKGYHLTGGVRKRVFFKDMDHEPTLRKVAVVYWTRHTGFITPHIVCPTKLNTPRTVAVLLHFKMLQDFHSKVQTVLAEKSHWNESAEYRTYGAKLAENGSLDFMTPRSVRYESSASLHGFTSWMEGVISRSRK